MSTADFEAFLDQLDALEPERLRVVKRLTDKLLQLAERQDPTEQVGDLPLLKLIAGVLGSQGSRMVGHQSTLLACYYLHLSGSDRFVAKQVNTFLAQNDCRPANTSTLLDQLRSREMLTVVAGEGLGQHKTYAITQLGTDEAKRLLRPEPPALVPVPESWGKRHSAANS